MKTDDSQLKLETKGVWIPICIWDNKELTLQEKAVLVKVESFKECFASNDYLAEFVNVSISRVKQVLKSLEDKGYIYRVVHRKEKVVVKRVISVDKAKFYGVVVETGICPSSDIGQEAVQSKDRKLSQPRAGNCPDNSKANNSAINKDSLSSKLNDATIVIDYLNSKAGRSFKVVEAHTRLISARLKESSLDEVLKVIDRKVDEWLDDPKMSKYLTPKTLFNATNFNNYVGDLGTPINKNMVKAHMCSEHEATRVLEIYNEVCGKRLIKGLVVSETLKRNISAVINIKLLDGTELFANCNLNAWRAYFHMILENPWNTGENPSGWVATIDYVTRPDTVIKTLEKKYA